MFQSALQTRSHETVLAERGLDQESGVLGSSSGSLSPTRAETLEDTLTHPRPQFSSL